jgi:hypothetical protein
MGLVIGSAVMFEKVTWKTWLLGIGGTLLLGALGSGLWEVGLRPLFTNGGTLVLSAVNLLAGSYKDAVYKHIAMGLHEHSSLHVDALLMATLCSVIINMVILLWHYWRQSFKPSVEHTTYPILIMSPRWRTGSAFWTISVFFMAFVFSLFINTISVSYETRAITHYNQLLRIVSPNLTSSQILQYESRFARIRTRGDFAVLISELEATAHKNGYITPDFQVW